MPTLVICSSQIFQKLNRKCKVNQVVQNGRFIYVSVSIANLICKARKEDWVNIVYHY